MKNNPFELIKQWKENNYKIAFFPGRTKPPHAGHIEAMRRLNELGYKIIIGNGSCYSLNPGNPLHVFEVQAMLELSLLDSSVGLHEDDFICIPIPDFDNDEKWCDFVLNIPYFNLVDAIYTNNPEVINALGNSIKYLEQITSAIIKNQFDISATKMRQAILENNVSTWLKFAPKGLRRNLTNFGGFERFRNALSGKEIDYEPGRQCIDMFIFVFDGIEWNVILGNRNESKKDFPGCLSCPGGGINDYENPIEATLRETTEETGIPIQKLSRYAFPAEIMLADELTHLYFVGMSSTSNISLGGSQGGSSLVFMTIYDGEISRLEYYIKSNSDLDNVRAVPVHKAIEQGLAFQQTDRLKQAWRIFEALRRRK